MKEIPIYDKEDLSSEAREGLNEYSDFDHFINEIVRMDLAESDIELIICNRVIDSGTKSRSKKELYHIQNILNRYDKKCAICNEEIPLNEVLYLDGNLCSYHQAQSEKEDQKKN